MTQKKNTSGMFAEVKVSDRNQNQGDGAARDSQWRYFRITYPNGVSLNVPSSIEPERLSALIYLR